MKNKYRSKRIPRYIKYGTNIKCKNKTCKAKMYKSVYGGYSNIIRSNRQYYY